MSQFTIPVDLRMLQDGTWQLLTGFDYHVGDYPSDDVITVPAGFITDLASVPRLFWSILPPFGEYAKAAILHDWCYRNSIGSKRYADDAFMEAMTVLGVAKWRRTVMYWAVRWFGKGNYK